MDRNLPRCFIGVLIGLPVALFVFGGVEVNRTGFAFLLALTGWHLSPILFEG